MGGLTDYTNNLVLDALFSGVPLPVWPTLYVGLSCVSANKRGDIVEPFAEDYQRVAVDARTFGPSHFGSKLNIESIGFPAPQSDWGVVASVFVADAPVGGNVIAMSDLATGRSFRRGRGAQIAPGGLRFCHA